MIRIIILLVLGYLIIGVAVSYLTFTLICRVDNEIDDIGRYKTNRISSDILLEKGIVNEPVKGDGISGFANAPAQIWVGVALTWPLTVYGMIVGLEGLKKEFKNH